MKQSITVVLVGLWLLAATTSVQSFRFDLLSGTGKCISEEVKHNVITVGTYAVVNNSSGAAAANLFQKITVKVDSPKGIRLHSADQVESGHFGFTTTEGGDYLACFWTPPNQPPITTTVDFDWKSGIAAKEWPKVAKRSKIDKMTTELKEMGKTIESINEEMLSLRERETERQYISIDTTARLGWLTLLSLAVSLSVAGLQSWHLKNFFVRKKLL